jgi:hypothetical protein
MRKFKTVLGLLVLFSFVEMNAQKYEYGNVTVAELEEKLHPKDTSAVAAVLNAECESAILIGSGNYYYTNTDTKMRIKIYKKEGLNWGQNRFFTQKGLNEKVDIYNAYTYNLVDGKIEKTKLDPKEGLLENKYDNNFGQKVLVMPNIKAGSVIEFNIVRTQNGVATPPRWDFQMNIPVNHSKFVTRIPEKFVFKTFQRGFIFPQISVLRKNGQNNTIEVVTTYTADDLPALKEEAFVNNIRNYTSSVSHDFSIINNDYGGIYNYAGDWESIVKSIYESDTFRYELDKNGYFKNELDPILEKSKTSEEKLDKIFTFVKSSVKWNNNRGIYCADGVRKAFISKTGNIAEINLMLTAMLRYSGFKASPVLISTRENGISVSPSISAFDCVIVAVEENDKIILLDASEKFSTPNVLPFRDLNWFGRLIRGDRTSKEIDLMPSFVSEQIVSMQINIDSKGGVIGKLRSHFLDHLALDFRTTNHLVTTNDYLENLENKYKIEISDYVRDNMEDLTKPVSETYSFKGDKIIEVVEGKIYMAPLLFLSKNQNPFKLEKRDFPIDFGYPKKETYSINLNIPEGYIVESLPKPLRVATPDGLESFYYNYQESDNKIQLIIINTINTAIVSSENYPTLKFFFQQMIDKQNEKIVFKKIQP